MRVWREQLRTSPGPDWEHWKAVAVFVALIGCAALLIAIASAMGPDTSEPLTDRERWFLVWSVVQ